jgi:hypothetical protein
MFRVNMINLLVDFRVTYDMLKYVKYTNDDSFITLNFFILENIINSIYKYKVSI